MRPVVFSRFSLLAAAAASVALVPEAHASFVGRSLTLPGRTAELGLGLGLGREDFPDATGLGLNLELGYGFGSGLELRLRTGVRFGHDGRITRADEYGRTFQTETYGTGGDSFANPEIALRWSLARGSAAELGLDARVFLPVGSDIGVMIALPVLLRLGSVRLDTGVYVPILFYDPTQTIVSIPLHLWIQISGGTYLGPQLGFRFRDGDTTVPLGFGFGRVLSGRTELRLWLLFRDVSDSGDAKNFGAGVGFSFVF